MQHHAITTASPPHDAVHATLRASAAAWTDLFDAVDEPTRRALGLMHMPIAGGTLLAAAGVEHLMLNRMLLAPPSAIDDAVAIFRRLGIARFLLSFDERDLASALAAGAGHALTRFRRPWETLVSTAPLGQTEDIAIPVRPATMRDARPIGELMSDGFELPSAAAPLFAAAVGRPRWTVLVVERDQRIAGAGMLFGDARAAYLFAGVTHPDYRRQGIQRALVSHRVRLARARGAAVIGSETGVALPGEPNPSWHNLVRAGLAPLHVTEHLSPSGASWSPA